MRKLPKVQATAPERIWLTVSDYAGDRRESFPSDHEGVCWSVDAPVDVCVPYVRADVLQSQQVASADRGEAVYQSRELGNDFSMWRGCTHAEYVARSESPNWDTRVVGELRTFCEGMNKAGKSDGYFYFGDAGVKTNYDLFVANVRSALGKYHDADAGLICSIALLTAEHDTLRQKAEATEASLAACRAAEEYEFEIWQDDAMQAGGTTSTLDAAVGEAVHYEMMYGQDGPVEVRYFAKRAMTEQELDAAIDAARSQP